MILFMISKKFNTYSICIFKLKLANKFGLCPQDQYFPNSGEHQNHLKSLGRLKIPGSYLRACFSVGLGQIVRMCTSQVMLILWFED